MKIIEKSGERKMGKREKGKNKNKGTREKGIGKRKKGGKGKGKRKRKKGEGKGEEGRGKGKNIKNSTRNAIKNLRGDLFSKYKGPIVNQDKLHYILHLHL